MRTSRSARSGVRLSCEALEDRLTPVVAYALGGATAGTANLLMFDTANPTAVLTTAINGLDPDETLVGIDFRPQNGYLYGLGIDAGADNGTLYSISTRTGRATAVGATGSVAFVTAIGSPTAVDLPAPTTTGYGFDFNPSADRIRVVAGSLNFRINPNTGAPIDGNGDGSTPPDPTNGTNTDGPIAGTAASLDGSAYTNNQANTTVTSLYGIDAASGSLYLQSNPNAGTTTTTLPITLNSSALTFTTVNGFDIPFGVNAPGNNAAVTTGSAFAVLTVGTTAGLYSIDLTNGIATSIGNVGTGATAISGFAVENDYSGLPAIGLNATGTALVRLNTNIPGGNVVVNITGINPGETLVGIDFRPATGQLYGLGVDATLNTATLYIIDPQGTAGVTTLIPVGTPGQISFDAPTDLPAASVGYGFDFNPAAAGGSGLVRVTTGSGLNFRIDPVTGNEIDGNGATAGNVPDTAVSGLPGGSTGVSATAYTNANGGATATTQYTLDAVSNSLFIQGAVAPGPNGGVQSNQLPILLNGTTALDFFEVNGFDISGAVRTTTSGAVADGVAYALLTTLVASIPQTGLYSIELDTGFATLIGNADVSLVNATGLAIGDAPGGTINIQNSTVSVTEGGAAAVVTFNRTGGINGSVTISLAVSGSATNGADFGTVPVTVNIPDGFISATLTLPITNDTDVEGTETAVLTITGVTGALLGTQAATTVTITDNDVATTPPGTTPPTTPPAINNAAVVGDILVLVGPSLPGGFVLVPVPFGSVVFLTDVTGDGVNDIVLFTPISVVALNGQTGQLLGIIADLDGDGVRDVLQVNPDGTTTTTNGRTGIVVTA